MGLKHKRRDQSGQAMLEYVLLLSVIVGCVFLLREGIARFDVGDRLLRPLSESYARAYKYGHPKAQGFDEGEPKNHPRIETGENNFRLFLNPGQKQ